ncbi:hypothetical protein [Paenibacillus herberti]|uniref:Uncharacterized protein n=1 Tax=Paenibacillus herberti TaxID=1619309 RepID=A0A229P5F8_9BACL|nr:hypothetical protein [Paenibacillus herberti]OXM17330.1 hypothetical protein CGZ75_12210 [Paenibacillus herberti]
MTNILADSDEENVQSLKTCFVIMPIADADGYEQGHFKRVYDYIIREACKRAGFKAIRADDVLQTNVIVVDIIKQILDCDMAICDLSGRNPNVLYELGIRQAFDKPVTLIKDNLTQRIFDISVLRDVEYSSSLRIDTVERDITAIEKSLKATYENRDSGDLNSLMKFVGIKPATEKVSEIAHDTLVILEAINNISTKVNKLEQINNNYIVKDFDLIRGQNVSHKIHGLGKITKILENGGCIVHFTRDNELVIVEQNSLVPTNRLLTKIIKNKEALINDTVEIIE